MLLCAAGMLPLKFSKIPYRMEITVSLFLLLLGPLFVFMAYHFGGRHLKRFDPIVLAYGAGLAFPLLGVEIHEEIAKTVGGAAIGLCLPLLILNMDIRSSLDLFPRAIFAMTLFCLSVIVCAAAASPLLVNMEHAKTVSGMLAATFIGSAPNLASVGIALNLPQSIFLQVQSVDLFVSACFLLFTISIGIPLILPIIPLKRTISKQLKNKPAQSGKSYTLGVFLSIGTLGLAVLISRLFSKEHQTLVAIVMIAGISMMLACIPVRSYIRNTSRLGEFCFWLFCVSTGSQISFQVIQQLPISLFYFAATLLLASIVVHFILCKLLKIEKHLFIVAILAGIFSPVMVVPLAKRIGGDHLPLVALTVGLLGLAVGSIGGLIVAHI